MSSIREHLISPQINFIGSGIFSSLGTAKDLPGGLDKLSASSCQPCGGGERAEEIYTEAQHSELDRKSHFYEIHIYI